MWLNLRLEQELELSCVAKPNARTRTGATCVAKPKARTRTGAIMCG